MTADYEIGRAAHRIHLPRDPDASSDWLRGGDDAADAFADADWWGDPAPADTLPPPSDE